MTIWIWLYKITFCHQKTYKLLFYNNSYIYKFACLDSYTSLQTYYNVYNFTLEYFVYSIFFQKCI